MVANFKYFEEKMSDIRKPESKVIKDGKTCRNCAFLASFASHPVCSAFVDQDGKIIPKGVRKDNKCMCNRFKQK